ncbi:MAG: phosphatase domain-containing protein [Pseudolysinimonas sp.]|uniref:App1 family protein n=1 Tax=Pseudolysinimonas sp. TaxID=2680009 RepID=UPI0032658783
MAGPAVHIGARIEDAVHAVRERWGRRAGLIPAIVPFVGYGGDGWIRVLARVVLRKPGVLPRDRFTSVRGWRSFTSITVRDAEVTITAGDATGVVHSDRGGVIDARFAVSLPPGWSNVVLSIGSKTGGGGMVDSMGVPVPIFVVDESTDFGMVSDVDDTVMVTLLPRPFLAAWNSFVINEHARTPVAGMPVLYERLAAAHPGSPVVYLSTGAWNVVPTLTRFLSRNLYPPGPLLLTDWGPTNERWFRNGAEHKLASLDLLATEFPGIRWLLIGDDGQADETTYGIFAERHPESVRAVAIRQLTPGQAVLAGGRSNARTHRRGSAPWVYASDGAGLNSQLRDLDLDLL